MEFDYDSRFQAPFLSVFSGCTSCGKSVLAAKIIKNRSTVINGIFDDIFWYYSIWQPLYDTLKDDVTFIKGVPEEIPNNTLIVVDDLILDPGVGKRLASVFTRESHHRNISLIFITQNIFHKDPFFRLINLNCQYLIIFKSPRSISQIKCLGMQMYPGKIKFFLDAYSMSTEEAFGYLMIDLRPTCPELLRLRTDILNPQSHTVFVPI